MVYFIQTLIAEIREFTASLGNNGRITYNIIFSYARLEDFSTKLAFLQFICGSLRQNLSMEIREVTALLGNDGKTTSDYKLVRWLMRVPWHIVYGS